MKYITADRRMQLELRNVCDKRLEQGLDVITELEPPTITDKVDNPFIEPLSIDYSVEKKWD